MTYLKEHRINPMLLLMPCELFSPSVNYRFSHSRNYKSVLITLFIVYFNIFTNSSSDITVIPSSCAFVSLLPAFSPANT